MSLRAPLKEMEKQHEIIRIKEQVSPRYEISSKL